MTGSSRQVLAVAKWAYVVLVAGFLFWAIWHAGGQPYDWRQWLFKPASLGFMACWALMALLLGAAWARVLDTYLGIRLSWRQWLPIQGAAWAGRYLPGKVGLMAGKLVLLERPGVELKPLTFSVLFEQFAFILVGGVVAVILSPPLEVYQLEGLGALVAFDTQWWRWGVAVAATAMFFALAHLAAARFAVITRPGALQVALLFTLYLLVHVTAGLGLHILLKELLGEEAPTFVYSIGLLAVANVAGIAAVFVPAGLGVREVVLALGLSPFLSIEEALALSATLRLLTVIADLTFSVAAGGHRLLRVVWESR